MRHEATLLRNQVIQNVKTVATLVMVLRPNVILQIPTNILQLQKRCSTTVEKFDHLTLDRVQLNSFVFLVLYSMTSQCTQDTHSFME